VSAANLVERNFRNPDEMEPEQMLKNLSIEENEDTSAQKQHCSLVRQINFISPQGCSLRPSTFPGTSGNTHINGSHNDFNADSDYYNERKECDGRNTNLENELKRNLLSHYYPNINRSEALDTPRNLEVSKELHSKGASASLADNLAKQKLDSAPPSYYASKGPYHHHNNSNNFLDVEMKYEPLINNISPNSNGISGPELLDACSGLPVNSDTMQSYAQEVTCVDGSFEIRPENKDAFLSNDSSCISNNLLPRSANKESSIPFTSHESRDTPTLNLKPIQCFDSYEVSDVKKELANMDGNLKLELSSIEKETDDIKTSCRAPDFQSGCDKLACAHKLTPVQCSDNAEVANVKRVTLDCTGDMDVENWKENMLSVGNISCALYNLRSRNRQGSSSNHISSKYKEDTRISVSDSREDCKSHTVDDMLIKKSPTYQMSSTRSCNVPSRNWYCSLRKRDGNLKVKKETDIKQNDKKHVYYKKVSGYNVRPRNAHRDELTLSPKGMFNHNPNRRYLQVKQISDVQVENQSPISTHTSCGMYNLRPRNRPVSGSVHKEGPRMCSSLGTTCKSVKVEDVIIKQETSVCDDNILSSPTLNCEKNNLHNCSSNDVQVKLNTVTHSGDTQTENETVICTNMSSITHNLRPRPKQGNCSKFLSLQYKKRTTNCSSNLSHSHKPDSVQGRKVREIKEEATMCDVDSFSRSYNMCSGVLDQNLGVDLKVEDEIIDDKEEKPKFCGSRSPYNLRRHCRNTLRNYSETNLYKNNCINSTEIVAAEDTTPRMSVKCFQLRDKMQNLEENASACSSMHVVSERSVSYHLRSRCILKEIQNDLSFRKDIKEEKSSEAEDALFETSKTVSGESIAIKSFKDANTEQFEQQLAEVKEMWPPSGNKPVSTKQINNSGDIALINYSKYACKKEPFCEDIEQKVVAKCADVSTTAQGRSVLDVNETNLDEILCLRSERHLQRNVGSQKHSVFHNKGSDLELLQNSQSHESCIGQDELQAFGDKKHGEEMDCLQSNTLRLCPSSIRSDFEPCEKQDVGTEACLWSGHRGSPGNNLALSEKVEIDCIEHPGAHDKNIGGLLSQMEVPMNNLTSLHAGSEKINNQDVFVVGLLGDLRCNDSAVETAETSEDTKKFLRNEASFMQDVNSTWQQTISDTVGNIHREEGLLLPDDADITKDEELLRVDNNIMIREQILFCVDNTNIAGEQKYVGDTSHSQSHGDLSEDSLNNGNYPKGCGTVNRTDAVDFDVNETNIDVSVPEKAGNDYRKSDISIPVGMSFPETGDAVTAEDFNMDGPSTLKISAPRESLLIEDDKDKVHEATDSQNRNDSDVDMVELCMSIPMPKMSLVDGSVPGVGMHAIFIK
jgi:hypothetical protein